MQCVAILSSCDPGSTTAEAVIRSVDVDVDVSMPQRLYGAYSAFEGICIGLWTTFKDLFALSMA